MNDERAMLFPPQLSRVVALDLDAYREPHVAEHIRRALAREGVADVVALTRLIADDPGARRRFQRAIAVPVSGLFRDRQQFDLLERSLLPRLLEDGRRLSVWSAGCADGAELYSVAQVIDRLGALDRSFLLGSDVLAENLAVARRGVYDDWHAPKRLRERLRWERRDLLADATVGGKWRLILCRNVAIYLRREAQHLLHVRLAGSLARGGVLLVGRSERIPDPNALGLEPAGPHAYRRTG